MRDGTCPPQSAELVASKWDATAAEFSLSVAGEVLLTTTDDGTSTGARDTAESHRLVGQLHQRAQALNGRCHLTSTPDSGHRLEWRVPLSRDEATAQPPAGTVD